jgi:hypothetical protein
MDLDETEVSAYVPVNPSDKNLKIYPNPSDGLFRIRSESVTEQLEVYDLMGNKIFSSTPSMTKNTIDLSQFPDGIYLVRIRNGKSFRIFKN